MKVALMTVQGRMIAVPRHPGATGWALAFPYTMPT